MGTYNKGVIMKVKKLKKLLEKFPDKMEVVIDMDKNGWFDLKKCKLDVMTLDGKKLGVVVNLVSSNES